MEGQETNVKSKIASSSVTAIVWISGLQEIVVLNTLHFNDCSFGTEDDSSATLHNEALGKKAHYLSNVYCFPQNEKKKIFTLIL